MQIRLKFITRNGKNANEYYKTKTGKLYNTKSEENNDPLWKFGKEFNLFLIMVVLSFTTLGIISQFAYFITYSFAILAFGIFSF